MSTKGHTSIQMNMAEVDKVTVSFNSQLKTNTVWPFAGWESDNSILWLAKAMGKV
ncbi:unnamed protein product [Nyctereutes procyonoides]|uniref:(raccoon dog) hypothetical protein n=1 Tax=Nyctereutes procyonoides TaxID=34880 RepID=A0A811ZP83_NYCPR|nr:unnamed protein product [Nyctereutes procyonoides]